MTQSERVVQYMKDFGKITSLDAFRDLGITRLSARIKDLRDNGVVIESKRVCMKNRYGERVYYAEYKLAE